MTLHRCQAFSVPFGRHTLWGDRLTPSKVRGTALILHGAGQSSASGFSELRNFLAERQIETLVFDAVGHGKTGGAQLGTTLAERVEQVRQVAQNQALDPRTLTIIGFSMGAYVAAKSAALIGATRLGLAIPAAYATEAFQVPFGPGFTAVLRTPGSWCTSDTFDVVARFTGHLLVISAEHDQAIPHAIPQRYFDLATCARSRRHHLVEGAGHDLSAHYAAAPEAQILAYHAITALCLSDLA